MHVDTTQLNVGEIELLQWQYGGDLGSFKGALWKAIQTADLNNLDRLAAGFPDQVEAYRRFSYEAGYWEGVLIRSGLVTSKPVDTPTEAVGSDTKPNYDH
jgi:hypothetical protein